MDHSSAFRNVASPMLSHSFLSMHLMEGDKDLTASKSIVLAYDGLCVSGDKMEYARRAFALIKPLRRSWIAMQDQDRVPRARSNFSYEKIVITSEPLTKEHEAGLNGAMLIWGK